MKSHRKDWVLVASQTYKGAALYFAKMTGIGPMTTLTMTEAARFATREEALQSPAMRFSLMSFAPELHRAAPQKPVAVASVPSAGETPQ